jgi:hypothetical protein
MLKEISSHIKKFFTHEITVYIFNIFKNTALLRDINNLDEVWGVYVFIAGCHTSILMSTFGNRSLREPK